MEETNARHWHPTAAYLYVLHLDGPALAWEYLRRNPDYRRDWLHRRRRDRRLSCIRKLRCGRRKRGRDQQRRG